MKIKWMAVALLAVVAAVVAWRAIRELAEVRHMRTAAERRLERERALFEETRL